MNVIFTLYYQVLLLFCVILSTTEVVTSEVNKYVFIHVWQFHLVDLGVVGLPLLFHDGRLHF